MADGKNTSEQENRIGLDEGNKLVFPTLNHSLITSSIELDGMFAQIFKAAYDDFVGFRPCWNLKTGRFTITACFEQKKYDESKVTAFEYGIKTDDNNSGLNRIQSLYRMASDGNKFHLTEEAKKQIERFMGPEARDRSREVLWNSVEVVSQLADPQTQVAMAPKTYNIINFIEPITLLHELYGTEANIYVGNKEDGSPIIERHKVEYDIHVIGPLPTQQFMQNEMQKMMFIQRCQAQGQPVPEGIFDQTYSYDPVKLLVVQFDGVVMESSAEAVGLHYRNQLGIDS